MTCVEGEKLAVFDVRVCCMAEYDSCCVEAKLQEPQRGSLETLRTPTVKG